VRWTLSPAALPAWLCAESERLQARAATPRYHTHTGCLNACGAGRVCAAKPDLDEHAGLHHIGVKHIIRHEELAVQRHRRVCRLGRVDGAQYELRRCAWFRCSALCYCQHLVEFIERRVPTFCGRASMRSSAPAPPCAQGTSKMGHAKQSWVGAGLTNLAKEVQHGLQLLDLRARDRQAQAHAFIGQREL